MKTFYFTTIFILFSIACFSQNQQVKEQELKQTLTRVCEDSKAYIAKGQVADYIPELSKADKDKVGIAVINSMGELYTEGDTKTKFTIQSISKVISLMIAVSERGESDVFKKVGYFGTDAPFNSFSELDLNSKPLNPMMNAGAILTTSLIKGEGNEPYQKILNMIRYITKNDSIDCNQSVYLSEKETGTRNRGMYYLLRSSGLIESEDEVSLNNYFRQCSIEVDVEDLAKIAYFFAHNCTRFDGDNVYYNPQMSKLINSVMLMSGMYDYSGEYSRKIGMPSKSGVGGGIIATVPGKYGIATFNPALDSHGNSAAGVYIMEELSRELNLSIF